MKKSHRKNNSYRQKKDNSFDFIVNLKEIVENRNLDREDDEKKSNRPERKRISFKNNFTFKPAVNGLKGIFNIFQNILNFYIKIFAFLAWILINVVKSMAIVFLFLTGKRKISFRKRAKKRFSFRNILDNNSNNREKEARKEMGKKRIKARNRVMPAEVENNIMSWPERELRDVYKRLRKEGKIESKKKKSELIGEFKYDRKRKIKIALSFLVVILILIIPFQILNYYNLLDFRTIESKVMNNSKTAIEDLKLASEKAQQLELGSASSYFSEANKEFSSAQEEIARIDKFSLKIASLSSNPKLKLASVSDRVVRIGVLGTDLGSNLGLALDSLFKATKGDDSNDDFVDILDNFVFYGKRALNNSRELEIEMDSIDEDILPEEYRNDFVEIKEANVVLLEGLDELISLAEGLKPFLGVEMDKRYLLVFQNNTELRASGGFMGSFALMDMKRGKIKNLEIPKGGSYDTEAGLLDKIVAPEPLWLVNPLWHFWDANWWPDWKKSAKNIAWFYEKSDGPTVDGVISFTPTVLESMLEVLGPIDMTEEYGVVITADNFWELVQPIVEEKVMLVEGEEGEEEVQNTQPKKIIGDLMFKILDEIPKRLDSQRMFDLIGALDNNLSQKQILLYFTDQKLQSEIEKHFWAGEIKEAPFDYLSVINTNIAGQKTDRKIKQKIVHESQVEEDGSIINNLTIYRYHTGEKWTEFTGVRNVNWLRIYVPLGSQLISANGFSIPDQEYFDYPEDDWLRIDALKEERAAITDDVSATKIYEDSGKTVFANWTMVDPGQTAVIEISYKLPFNFLDRLEKDDSKSQMRNIFSKTKNIFYPYSLVVQKQPGDLNTELESRLKINTPEMLNLWHYPHGSNINNSGWEVFSDLDRDKYFGSLWSRMVEK